MRKARKISVYVQIDGGETVQHVMTERPQQQVGQKLAAMYPARKWQIKQIKKVRAR